MRSGIGSGIRYGIGSGIISGIVTGITSGIGYGIVAGIGSGIGSRIKSFHLIKEDKFWALPRVWDPPVALGKSSWSGMEFRLLCGFGKALLELSFQAKARSEPGVTWNG